MHRSTNKNLTKLPAGEFSTWLRTIRKAIKENRGTNVPCGGCVACCSASCFIHIKSSETDTLRRIPKELLAPAPWRPKGDMVLGYFKDGCCPMIKEKKCSIYEHRPYTCRIFDCRILAATGLGLKSAVHNPILQQARLWKFQYRTKRAKALHAAVQDAAKFLTRHKESIKNHVISTDVIQLSVLAVEVYDVFLGRHKYRMRPGMTITDYDNVKLRKVLAKLLVEIPEHSPKRALKN